MEYAPIVRSFIQKPLFLQLSNFAEMVKKQVVKTKKYFFLHIIHTALFVLFFLVGLIRLQTGLEKEQPVFLLCMTLVGLFVVYFVSLWQLNVFFPKWTIP